MWHGSEQLGREHFNTKPDRWGVAHEDVFAIESADDEELPASLSSNGSFWFEVVWLNPSAQVTAEWAPRVADSSALVVGQVNLLQV